MIQMAYRATKAGSLKAASSVARGESFNVLMMTLKVVARVLSNLVNSGVYLEGRKISYSNSEIPMSPGT